MSMEDATPSGWRVDSREIATAEGRIRSWIHESEATATVRGVNGAFEVVLYPEECADYVGFVEIEGEFADERAAVARAVKVMREFAS